MLQAIRILPAVPSAGTGHGLDDLDYGHLAMWSWRRWAVYRVHRHLSQLHLGALWSTLFPILAWLGERKALFPETELELSD
jgi:hypothetical protein